jgi:hypothetical protein
MLLQLVALDLGKGGLAVAQGVAEAEAHQA